MRNSSALTETPRCDWDFSLSAVISPPSASASDAIGVLEFDHTNSLLASGGIARKIRIYNAQNLSRENGGGAACEYYIYTPAKLSSLKWKPGSGSRVIGSGDYDGLVMEYDLEKRVAVFERDEHGGRRVWSIDYSSADPTLGASASDDGTMQMWDTRCHAATSVASIRPACSPVCSVEFDPFRGRLLSLGCADRKIYGYDARMMLQPVFVLEGHDKAVSYARFLDPQTVVSSSVDGSLMMWHAEEGRLLRRYRGHVNTRRFVGLSVWRAGGLFSCGSENNRVFVYDKRWAHPIWACAFDTTAHQGFVSSVCWKQLQEDRCTLVAGASDGVLQLFQGIHRLTAP